jgi:hypothetical protein
MTFFNLSNFSIYIKNEYVTKLEMRESAEPMMNTHEKNIRILSIWFHILKWVKIFQRKKKKSHIII